MECNVLSFHLKVRGKKYSGRIEAIPNVDSDTYRNFAYIQLFDTGICPVNMLFLPKR